MEAFHTSVVGERRGERGGRACTAALRLKRVTTAAGRPVKKLLTTETRYLEDARLLLDIGLLPAGELVEAIAIEAQSGLEVRIRQVRLLACLSEREHENGKRDVSAKPERKKPTVR